MYFIYKIENLINHKTYIGSSDQSRGFTTGWYEHQQNARLESRAGYEYPLYRAIRKYGIENFNFQILIKDIQTPEERYKLEHDTIIEYNSLTSQHGYNQTLNTEYPFDDPEVRAKLATPICAISETSGEKKFFPTITAAAHELGTDRASIRKCASGSNRYKTVKGFIFREYNPETLEIIPNNIPIEEASKLIEINGEFHNFKDWCSIYNISKNSVYKRMKNGMSRIEAITTPKRK